MERRIDDQRPSAPLEWEAKHAAMDRAGELPLERRVAERRAEPPALVTVMAETVAKLTRELATSRNDALEEAAKACDEMESDMFDQYKGRGKHAPNNEFRADQYMNGQSDGAGQCAAAIRALASQPAAPVQPEGSSGATVHSRLMEISDIVRRGLRWDGNEHVFAKLSETDASMIDDLLGDALRLNGAAPTPSEAVHQFRSAGCSDWYDGHPDHSDGGEPYETRTLYRAAPPVQQPGDVRDTNGTIDGGDVSFNQVFVTMDEKPSPELWTLGNRCYLATTRPSAALTDEQIIEIARPTFGWAAGCGGFDVAVLEFVKNFLAASSGAVAVPEGWQPIETAPKYRKIDLWTGEARLTGCYWDRACGEWRKTDESGHIIRTRVATYWHAIPAAPATPAQGQTK